MHATNALDIATPNQIHYSSYFASINTFGGHWPPAPAPLRPFASSTSDKSRHGITIS